LFVTPPESIEPIELDCAVAFTTTPPPLLIYCYGLIVLF